MAGLRSLIYMLLQAIITPPYALFALACFPLPPHRRYQVTYGWTRLMLFMLRTICGLRYEVLGRENIPVQPSIILSKHQSAWETLALQQIFPPQVWVLKKELLRIPFFGWGLAMTSPIAIDRSAGKAALEQIVEQGRERLQQNFWIVVFPEGTRIPPGKKGKYRIGGAWLAVHTGALAVPVAHNAGQFWGRNSFIKYPGTIILSIGKPIDPNGIEAGELMARVEAWIEAETTRISCSVNRPIK
ncbi:1-acyl-sn-glycerol-3-phosphate acyltransferase [Nitrosomonas eutropha]|uniref:lysophospholipid acyltransferase family protein n=1 Tax=Nitrosomonas TaxID=914 RepID=UPI0008879838|nr:MULTISPECIES: lysophospholipid acyltransferase family protein [Nitrosomonas]MXS80903.1 1-acyl-sn-glycerol-3-phosphate acyltransferase [Nitrosomonas sp. GH22]SCX28706.1 1-acyl-sn-glycerol-3-phosphate acyltransferase [Nitrosomonas eutropha]